MKDHVSRSHPPLTPHCDVVIPQKSYLEPIVFPGFCTTKRPLDRGAVLKEIRKHLATKGLCKKLPTQPWNPHTPMPSARGSCFTFVVAEIFPPVASEPGERAFESLLSRWISRSWVDSRPIQHLSSPSVNPDAQKNQIKISNNSQRNPGTPTLQCLLVGAHPAPSLPQNFPHLLQVSRERGLLPGERAFESLLSRWISRSWVDSRPIQHLSSPSLNPDAQKTQIQKSNNSQRNTPMAHSHPHLSTFSKGPVNM